MENKNYWKGIAELEETPEFISERDKEFASELPIEEIFSSNFVTKPRARRDFLKMLGFSVTAATVAASCRIPVREAIPYIIKPEEIVPGLANYYASTYSDGSDYCSILVKTRDGRPIKIEGNKNSSITKGGTNARAQASILSLYDNERAKVPHISSKGVEWDTIDGEIKSQLDAVKAKGGNIRILSSTILSPSTKNVIADFGTAFGNTKHVVFEPMSNSGILYSNEKSFGKRVIPGYSFDKAKVIVSFGADFLGTWISPVEYIKQYVTRRKVSKENSDMSRHYQFESHVSLTGTNADKRVAIKPSEQNDAVIALYNLIAAGAGKSTISGGKVSDKAAKSLSKAAAELLANKGASLVVCGSNDANCQTIVNAINDMLGSYGNTIDLDNYSNAAQGNDKDVMSLIGEMEAGTVDALIIYNSNPVYVMGKKFADAMKKVPTTISLNDRFDETTSLVKYACPDNHYLESWNDAEPRNGKYSLGQPAINPIFNTRQAQTSLLKWSGSSMDYLSYLKSNWEKNMFASQSTLSSFQSFWDETVRNGVYEKAPSTSSATFAGDVNAAAAAMSGKAASGMELVVFESVGLGNGKYANTPWLLEMPDPVTKIVWDTVVAIPVPWAKENNLVEGDVVEVSANGTTMQLPVVLQPGMANGTFAVAVGLGREKAGRAGNGVGKNVYPFVSSNGETMIYSTSGVTVKPIGGEKYPLAITQTHGTFEGRNIIQQTTLSEYKKNPSSGNESIKEHEESFNTSLYPKDEHQYNGLRWGMNIDLNSCIGCSACHVACTVENNVPVVGKDEVRRVHEMHWLRIDRYYSFAGDGGEKITKESHSNAIGLGNQYDNVKDWEDIEVIHQPMLCQHCENAPCENVCPVAATNHSSEGLNQMTYNRCIGTRYCANNCPFKVRRFNWFDYTTADSFPWNTYDKSQGVAMMIDDLTRMVLNPDVTVRSRGVIEKCSFCVQRLQDAKLNAKKQDRPLGGDEAKTACQTACPADAITFGNINDKESSVSKTREDERNYYLLDELHVKSSIGYMVKVRNNENMA